MKYKGKAKIEIMVFLVSVLIAIIFLVYLTSVIIKEKDKETAIKIHEAELNVVSHTTIRENHVKLLRSMAEEVLYEDNAQYLEVKRRIIDVEGFGWELLPSEAHEATSIGRLTGAGLAKDIDNDELREIYAIEKLNRSFLVVQNNLRNSPYVFYNSHKHFANLVPRMLDDAFFFFDGLLDYELFVQGLPENNKNRTVFWTKPYIDAGFKGVTVTVSAPLYYHDKFLGTLCIDMIFNEIADYLQSGIFDENQISLVDNYSQIVSSSIPLFSNSDSLQSFKDLINDERNDINLFETRNFFWFKNNRIFISPLPNPNWFIVHIETKSEYCYAIAKRILPTLLGVILMLFIIYFLIYINRLRILNQKEKIKAEEANATKNKFFSIIAHDLRSPFNAIIGFSNELQGHYSEYDEKERQRFIKHIFDAANKTFQLLNNLLDWARTQTNEIAFNPERHNIEKVFIELIEQYASRGKEKNIEISYIAESNIDAVVDINMIRTILRNLISNAIKFTRRNGKIEICAELKETKLIVSVKDTGVGISLEKQKELFDLSKETTTLGTENEKGTGLGLVLCNEFVKRHCGKIWVESKENVGTLFLFEIPLNLKMKDSC
jgi:signal transduction histidine kinase